MVTVSGSIHSVTTNTDIEHIVLLARRIWTEHYVPIIGSAQVDYMLEHFQSKVAIAQQIKQGHEYFLLSCTVNSETATSNTTSDTMPVGYLDVVLQPNGRLFLSKLYVVAAMRCRGFGRQLFE